MSIPKWKKNFILVFGYLENLIFSGTIFGWSALLYMLISENVYLEVCDVVETNYRSNNHNNSITNPNSTLITEVRDN
jgi:hypothetical protein